MSLFRQSALNEGVRRREVFGWAMYDFANSGYTTVVLTAVFNTYFVGVVAQGAPWATLAWTLMIAASSLVVMLTMPSIGAHVDRLANKRRWLAMSTAGCVVATLGLSMVGRGDVALAAVVLIVANVCYSYGESLIAAFLPELARPAALGRVSGWGWSFGYCGGMLSLGLCLAYVMWAQGRGLPSTDFVPVTMLITAAVYGVASLVTFALLTERASPQKQPQVAAEAAGAFRLMARTWREARLHPEFMWFLVCGACYQSGIAVVIALAAVYAEQALGFQQSQTMMLVFLVNVAAAAGAFAFGYVQDRAGHKRSLAITLVGWIVMTLLAVAAEGPNLFWVAAVIAGLCMGSSQSAGRAIVGALSPAQRRAEFYGLWTFATRLSAVVGPVTYGLVTLVTSGNHRLAILSTAIFFVVGLLLLLPVDVSRGMARAKGRGVDVGEAARQQ